MPVRANAPDQLNTYKAYLRELMAYFHGHGPYPIGHEFTDAELLALRPDDIYKWMAYKVYHNEEPGPDDRPLFGRASSLAYYKKAISFFMPNRNMAWNAATNQGNPCRSTQVNDLIRAVKKKQVRGLGKESQADRPFEKEEFEQQISILQSFADLKRKYMYPAMFKFQFHLIARIDDTVHVRKDSLKPCPQFQDIALSTQLRWSKNVNEERDAPTQILLGAMDERYCILLALALYLEVFIETGEGRLGDFLFCEAGCNQNAVKSNAQSVLKKDVIRNPACRGASPKGKLGSHSNRKFGTTYPRRSGCSKDETDYRASWKGHGRQSDVYTDVELHWPDLKVASKLCVGGPCKYALKEGSGLSDDWLVQNVTPNIADVYGAEVAAILAKPLLWALFEDILVGSDHVPQFIHNRVIMAYNNLNERLPNDQNPIKKIRLVPWGEEAEVHLDEVPDELQQQPQQGGLQQEQMIALYARVLSMERKQDDFYNEYRQDKVVIHHRFTSLERNVRRIALQPVQRVRAQVQDIEGEGDGPGPTLVATLSKCPRDLYVLWTEYEVGLAGRKPARLFTAHERGKVKFKYSRRKVVWDAIDRMIRSGSTSDIAVDSIYNVHGRNKSVSEIIQCLRNDGPQGHPNLR